MATQDKKINYYSRNFADVRNELVNFIKLYYPDIFSDFNDASVGMMLLELNAAVCSALLPYSLSDGLSTVNSVIVRFV